MKITINRNQLNSSYPQFLRQAGYEYIEDRRSGQASFVRKLGGGRYPRFHIYVNERDDQLTINLHLDQKQASYEGTSAHSGEYADEGPVLAEGQRLKSLLDGVRQVATARKLEPNNPWSSFKK